MKITRKTSENLWEVCPLQNYNAILFTFCIEFACTILHSPEMYCTLLYVLKLFIEEIEKNHFMKKFITCKNKIIAII